VHGNKGRLERDAPLLGGVQVFHRIRLELVLNSSNVPPRHDPFVAVASVSADYPDGYLTNKHEVRGTASSSDHDTHAGRSPSACGVRPTQGATRGPASHSVGSVPVVSGCTLRSRPNMHYMISMSAADSSSSCGRHKSLLRRRVAPRPAGTACRHGSDPGSARAVPVAGFLSEGIPGCNSGCTAQKCTRRRWAPLPASVTHPSAHVHRPPATQRSLRSLGAVLLRPTGRG
jgi:hypothetical protein